MAPSDCLKPNDIWLNKLELLLLFCALALGQFCAKEGLQSTDRPSKLNLCEGLLHAVMSLFCKPSPGDCLKRGECWHGLLDVPNKMLLLPSGKNATSGGLNGNDVIGRIIQFLFMRSMASANEYSS